MIANSVRRVAAVLLVVCVTTGCGATTHADQASDGRSIARAKKTNDFAAFASIFPSSPKSVACSVSSGAPGNVFHGRCSTAVAVDDGQTTVTFAQDFGTHGRHVWRIAVPASGNPHVVSQSGGGLVQLIP